MGTAEYMLNVADVVELEHRIAEAGTSLYELMQNAGAAVARAAWAHMPASGYAVIMAGTGNNGGDGWVAAKLLAEEGAHVTLVTPKRAEELTAEPARAAAHDAEQAVDFTILVKPAEDRLRTVLSRADVVVDALLGTGFSGAKVKEPLDSWIEAANAAHDAGAYLIAADVPSGVSAQTGKAAMPHVQADETVTMIAAKPGLYCEAGFSAAGHVQVADICDLSAFKAYLEERAIPRSDFVSRK